MNAPWFSHWMKPLTAIAVCFAAVTLSWLQLTVSWIRDGDSDFLLRLRGPRSMSPDVVLVTIDEDDIRALGGWPVTRDYYGYLIHILSEKNAKVIGLDVLLDSPNREYPEYDRLLSDFILTTGRVVLPDVLDETRPSDQAGRVKPLPVFSNGAAGVGFSNLGESIVVRRVPLVLDGRESFGLVLARTRLGATSRTNGRQIILTTPNRPDIRIPVDEKGRLLLNPAGCVSTIRSIRMTSLMRTFETDPDSLDFSDKIVLVAATAPSLPVIRSTPLCSRLPASLIHATVAENIIDQTWLRDASFGLSLFWILVCFGCAFALSSIKPFRFWMTGLAAGLVALPGLALGTFALFHYAPPLTLSFWILLVMSCLLRWRESRKNKDSDVNRLGAFEAQIALKENELIEAEKRLADTQALLAREMSEKHQLSETIRRTAEEKEAEVLALEKQVRDLKASSIPIDETGQAKHRDIIHGSESPMAEVLRMLEKVAMDDIPVLIQGETGTGKELIARAIHQSSHRHRKPFVAVNCGALSENLLESELFGHEKGAFTGAAAQRKGRFELADGGTLFLDEITATSPAFQTRLLRVLQEGAFERVGSERTLRADVRIIAAHNRDLNREVAEKRFREDLYFRLKGFPITLPPLRNRAEDIPLLVRFFIQKYGSASSIRPSEAALERLGTYRWPGNVRELENAIRRSVLLAKSDGRGIIQLKDLPEEIQKENPAVEPVLYRPFETQIMETLRAFRFSHSAIGRTAEALGNRDRGTVTEYFRGLCFQFLAENNGNVKQAAAALASSDEPEVLVRVETKMRGYVENIRESLIESSHSENEIPSCFKGLPRKFHPHLQRIIDSLQ